MTSGSYPSDMPPSKPERIAAFLQRLVAAAPAASHDEALALVRNTLNAVEDELTSIPYGRVGDTRNVSFD